MRGYLMVLGETFSRGTLDPWYVTGFVEGEGAFTYSRSGRQLALYFAIKLTGQESELLNAIQEFFGGVGRIYGVKPAPSRSPNSGYTKAALYYRVTRQADLRLVLEHFDAHPLRGNKARSYEIWREMVLLKQAFRQPDRPELDRLAQLLSSISPRQATSHFDVGGGPEQSGSGRGRTST